MSTNFKLELPSRNYHKFAIKSLKIFYNTFVRDFLVLLHCLKVGSDEDASKGSMFRHENGDLKQKGETNKQEL